MKKRKKQTALTAMKLLFWLYVAFLVVFVVIKFHGSMEAVLQRIETNRYIRSVEPGYNLNLIPLRTIQNQLEHIHSGWAARNLLANAVVFIPFGYLLPRAHRHIRRWYFVLGVSLVSICAIETVQYITFLGACDVDDLILNLIGCLTGWFIYRLGGKE